MSRSLAIFVLCLWTFACGIKISDGEKFKEARENDDIVATSATFSEDVRSVSANSLARPQSNLRPKSPTHWTFKEIDPGEISPNTQLTIVGSVDDARAQVVWIYSDAGCGLSLASAPINAQRNFEAVVSLPVPLQGDGDKPFWGRIEGQNALFSEGCSDLGIGYRLERTPKAPSSVALVDISSGATTNSLQHEMTGTLTDINAREVFVYLDDQCQIVAGRAAVQPDVPFSLRIEIPAELRQDGIKTFYGRVAGVETLVSPGCTGLGLSLNLVRTPKTPQSWELVQPLTGTRSNRLNPIFRGSIADLNADEVQIFADDVCSKLVGSSAISADGTFSLEANLSGIAPESGDKKFYGQVKSQDNLLSMGCTDLLLGYVLVQGQIAATLSTAVVAALPPNTDSFMVTVAFTRDVVGLRAQDLNVTFGTVVAVVGTGRSFAVRVAPASHRIIEVSLPAGRVADDAGNVNNESNRVTVTLEPANPALVALESPVNGSIANVTAPIFVGTHPRHSDSTVQIYDDARCLDPVGQGVVAQNGTFRIVARAYPGNGAQDGLKLFWVRVRNPEGLPAAACPSTGLQYTLSTRTLTATLTLLTADPLPSTSDQARVRIDFSAALSAFVATALTVENGTVVTVTGTGQSFTVVLEPTNRRFMRIRLAAGSVADIAGNRNIVSGDLTFGVLPKAPSGWQLETPLSGSTSNQSRPIVTGTVLRHVGATAAIYLDLACAVEAGNATINAQGMFRVQNILFATDSTANGTKRFFGRIRNQDTLMSPGCSYLGLFYQYVAN